MVADIEAEARLREITAEFEKNFPTVVEFEPVENRPAGISPTGEPYIVVCQRGSRNEGEEVLPFSTSAECLASYEFHLKSMVPTSSASLYWRTRPEIDCIQPAEFGGMSFPGGWIIYSRFLISDKPRTHA